MLGTCKAIGDIDAGAAFGVVVLETVDNSDEPLVSVDCAGVTFMDPAGFHVLVDATHYAARRGRTLVIRNMSSSCARLIRLYGWDPELRVESSRRAPGTSDASWHSRPMRAWTDREPCRLGPCRD